MLCEIARRAGGIGDSGIGLTAKMCVYWDASLGVFRSARDEEIQAGKCEGLYVVDAWGRPLVYRLVRSASGGQEYRVLVYSVGANGIDETALGVAGDDIGNW